MTLAHKQREKNSNVNRSSRFGGPSRWECLGKGLAFMQMHKVLFEMFRHFDLRLVDPANPWKASGTRIWVIEDFFAQITKRSPVKP